MTGAEAAVVAPIVGGALAGGGAAAGGKSGGSAEIPNFFKRAAGDIAASTRRAQMVGLTPSLSNFDEAGNLLLPAGSSFLQGGGMPSDPPRNPFFGRIIGGSRSISDDPSETKGISAETKALAEAMNFFGNLYNNQDINAALGEFRGRLDRDPETGLVSDPAFNIIRERGVAESIEAGRRLGGLRSSGTGRGVADFLTSAEAQQRLYEDERAASAANALFNLNFLRGQAGFLPTQTLGSVVSSLGGATSFAPIPQFSNTAGLAGDISSRLFKQGAGAAQQNKGNAATMSMYNAVQPQFLVGP